MRAFTRLSVAVLGTITLVLFTTITFFPNTSTHLKKIGVKPDYVDEWWKLAWNRDEGIRIVVFGDSWVGDGDGFENHGKGKSWTKYLCQKLSCKVYQNFASSQPSSSYPASPPTGAITSNDIYLSKAHSSPNPAPPALEADLLPDLEAQIQEFLAQPPPERKPKKTYFVVSFGIWDVYHFAGLEPDTAMDMIERSVEKIFEQLDVLYEDYIQDEQPTAKRDSEMAKTRNDNDTFQVIIPKLFDPTLLPGWLTQRPRPLSPSSISEQQKNAVYLTTRWNAKIEHQIRLWIKGSENSEQEEEDKNIEEKEKEQNTEEEESEEESEDDEPTDDDDEEEEEENKTTTEKIKSTLGLSKKAKAKRTSPPIPSKPQKDVFYHDASKYLLEQLIEYQMQKIHLSDASGLGKKGASFESVGRSCVRMEDEDDNGKGKWNLFSPDLEGAGVVEFGKVEGRVGGLGERSRKLVERRLVERNGQLVCKKPAEYLFWDGFGLGGKAKERIGEVVAGSVREGKSVRAYWGESGIL